MLKQLGSASDTDIQGFREPRGTAETGNEHVTSIAGDLEATREPSWETGVVALFPDQPLQAKKRVIQHKLTTPPSIRTVDGANTFIAAQIAAQLGTLECPALIDALGKDGWSIEVRPYDWDRMTRLDRFEPFEGADRSAKTIIVFDPGPRNPVEPDTIRLRLAHAIAEAVDIGALRPNRFFVLDPKRFSDQGEFKKATGTGTWNQLLLTAACFAFAIPTFGLSLFAIAAMGNQPFDAKAAFGGALAGILLSSPDDPAPASKARAFAERALHEILPTVTA